MRGDRYQQPSIVAAQVYNAITPAKNRYLRLLCWGLLAFNTTDLGTAGNLGEIGARQALLSHLYYYIDYRAGAGTYTTL